MVVLVAPSLEALQHHPHSNRLQPSQPHSHRFLVRANLIFPGSSNPNPTSSKSRLILNPTPGNSIPRGGAFYQPYRPPPTIPDSGTTIDEMLQIVSERRGQWFEFGKHIPLLLRSGFTPATLDDATGLNGVEQNQIMVGSQVRDALVSSGMSDESLRYFNSNSAVLYELRILSAQQRRIAAQYVIDTQIQDAKSARDAARALKDFGRRKREFGWDFFSSDAGDTLAFWWYRQSKEFKDEAQVNEALKKALGFATSEKSKQFLKHRLSEKTPTAPQSEKKSAVELTRVVRLNLGETSGLVMLPVADPDADSIREAPSGSAVGDGGFRIHRSSHAWKAWVPLPGWKPILEAIAPITVLFPERDSLGLQDKRSDEDEELLLVVDKGRLDRNAEEPGAVFLVVASEENELQLETSDESENEVLGRVLFGLTSPDSGYSPDEELDMDD